MEESHNSNCGTDRGEGGNSEGEITVDLFTSVDRLTARWAKAWVKTTSSAYRNTLIGKEQRSWAKLNLQLTWQVAKPLQVNEMQQALQRMFNLLNIFKWVFPFRCIHVNGKQWTTTVTTVVFLKTFSSIISTRAPDIKYFHKGVRANTIIWK